MLGKPSIIDVISQDVHEVLSHQMIPYCFCLFVCVCFFNKASLHLSKKIFLTVAKDMKISPYGYNLQ